MVLCIMSINIKGLKKKYKNHLVLNDINFTFEDNKIYIIEGENGIGKSTLFKAILGQISYYGNIEIDGNIAFSPEEASLPSYSTIKKYYKLFNNINFTNLNDFLNLFEISKYYNYSFYKLSKGTRQKISIIQVLLSDNSILLFDEPLTGLDQKSQETFYEIIKKYTNKLIIITSHLKPTNITNYMKLKFKEGRLCISS